ncbi:MAG: molecular chaperone TorD family protein [Pseudomonadota bacterium]
MLEPVDVEAAAMRAGVWRLLAGGLACAPSDDWLAQLRKIEAPKAVHDPLGWAQLADSAHDVTLDSVQDEYFRLFIGVGRGELMPYGSWYLTGFLMEKPLALLRQDLRRLGIERADGVRESEDQIGLLADTQAKLIDGGDEPETAVGIETQRDFFNAHIGPWASQFFDDLSVAESAIKRRRLGRFGGAFTRLEQQYLAMPA